MNRQATVMRFGETAGNHESQAHPRLAIFLLRAAIKDIEDALLFLRGDPRPGIAHLNHNALFTALHD